MTNKEYSRIYATVFLLLISFPVVFVSQKYIVPLLGNYETIYWFSIFLLLSFTFPLLNLIFSKVLFKEK
ncbi:MAG: hypothetical protein ACTSPJ_05425 [Candidatus Heimdallarchaeaceae archaeon]